ncbi:MAG: hypothetical protein N2Z76_09940 [Treponemataceae bacterium]|nr:hypothetical protein [Treponemataceae bacterium]
MTGEEEHDSLVKRSSGPLVWDRRPGDAWRSAVWASKSCDGKRAYQRCGTS